MTKNFENKDLKQVPKEALECEVFRADIIGYTGETFCNRPVVLFRQRPGVFGATSVKKAKIRKYTLHNGILNQCSVHADGKPGVYWAVLDAMSELKTNFTREQVISKAVATLVKYDGRFRGDARKACASAFYILKTHTSHPARKNMGFGFLVEKGTNKQLTLRARNESEVSNADSSEEKPLATIIVNERG